MLTTLLEVLGLLLIVVAAWLGFGVAIGMLAAGACCLTTSWTITRARKR